MRLNLAIELHSVATAFRPPSTEIEFICASSMTLLNDDEEA